MKGLRFSDAIFKLFLCVCRQQGHANMPYHSKYAPYVLPSARESELQSHVSDSNRQKKHVDPVNRDILDFDVAKQMAQLNIVQQEERLPTTMNQVSAVFPLMPNRTIITFTTFFSVCIRE